MINKHFGVFAFTVFGAISFLFGNLANAAQWSYSGANGPDKWAKLSADNKLCDSGKNQSPVDINTKKTADGETRGIKFNYGLIKPETITNTGNFIQVSVAGGASLKTDGVEFELKRLEIHIPSEHTINKKHYPMEIEFIHESKDKQLANVSMMVIPGRPDRTLRQLLLQLPIKIGESKPLPANALRNIEMKKKLGNYYRYSGSVTTPPCTEGVHWFIMKAPMTISKEQYQKFKEVIKQDNNRPVQKLNARMILE